MKYTTIGVIPDNILKISYENQTKSSINVTNDYLLEKIIVYDGVFNYEN